MVEVKVVEVKVVKEEEVTGEKKEVKVEEVIGEKKVEKEEEVTGEKKEVKEVTGVKKKVTGMMKVTIGKTQPTTAGILAATIAGEKKVIGTTATIALQKKVIGIVITQVWNHHTNPDTMETGHIITMITGDITMKTGDITMETGLTMTRPTTEIGIHTIVTGVTMEICNTMEEEVVEMAKTKEVEEKVPLKTPLLFSPPQLLLILLCEIEKFYLKL